MPVFDKLESYLVQQLHFTPGSPLRLIARSTYVGKYIIIVDYNISLLVRGMIL